MRNKIQPAAASGNKTGGEFLHKTLFAAAGGI
jgi:hypothetical protein